MKRTVCAVLAAAILLTGMNITAIAAQKVTLYVSPDGSDSSKGTIDAPLRTLNGARKTVQQHIEAGNTVDVIFRGGEYRMDTSVSFTAADSGTKDAPVTYKAYEGERVEFKGSVALDMSKARRITDDKILSRLYPDARNKVVEIDLAEQGVDTTAVKQYKLSSSQHPLQGGEVNGLFQNGSTQTVSEWPNGFGNYTSWDYAESAATFHYTDTQPNRWSEAKYAWVGGYHNIDYQYSRKSIIGVDTINSTITCQSGSMGFSSAQSRRWKAYHLLEEIDVPGEYYIDPDTMKLYWYPEVSLTDSVVEFVVNNGFLNIQFAENITFENLCFTQCRETAIKMKQVKNVDFIGCEITNAGQQGMYVYSGINAETDRDYWMRNMLDGSYDCDILNCRFDNTGHSAIDINGGNVDTLTKSNDRIENNIITRSAQLSKNFPAIWIRGCGISVKNNNISNLPFHAINFWGNDHDISYNEIYDVIQESDDCGAIYDCRNTLHRGSEIAYNYIHDIVPVKELVYNFQGAIYLDDSLGGQSVHHNIIKNARIDIIVNGGVDNDFRYNTSVDIDKYHLRLLNGGISENANSFKERKWQGYIKDEALYYEHYPNLKEIIAIGRESTRDERLAKFTKVVGNLGVNYSETSIGTNTLKYGKVANNIELDECNDFVDAERGDYRIKKDSETYRKLPNLLNEDFDISLIGVQHDYNADGEDSRFLQLYPKNGQEGLNAAKVDFAWQAAKDANTYRLVIAEDRELKNVVYDDIVHYTKTSVDTLDGNKVYYWKVYAENISYEYGNTWESESPVFSFATSPYEVLDTAHLDEVAEKTKEMLDTIDTGEEPGQYPITIKTKVTSLLDIADMMKSARLGMLKQKNIDSMANVLASVFTGIGKTNKGYLDLSKYFSDAVNWTKPVQVNSDGSVTVNRDITGAANSGIKGLGNMAGSVIYSFDAKLTVPETYAIFGINKDPDINPYAAANNGYSFLFKPNVIELHVTNGTSQVIAREVEHSFANDGKFHNIRYGYINTEIGNIVMLYVDGQRVVEYLDVINQAVKVQGTFMMHIAGAATSVDLKQADNIGTEDELDALVNDALYLCAKEIIGAYETGVTVIQENGNKIFTPKGVYATEGVTMPDGVMMIPFNSVSMVLGFETSQNGNELVIRSGEKIITFTIGENSCVTDGVKTGLEKGAQADDDGIVRVPVEALLKAVDQPYYYSHEHGLLVVGSIIYMNNLNAMNKTRLLMNMMKDMPKEGDYIFEEHE